MQLITLHICFKQKISYLIVVMFLIFYIIKFKEIINNKFLFTKNCK